MGGYGSGRHHGAKKRRVESCRVLDVKALRREGALTPGASGTITWARDGEQSVAFRADAAELVLSYHDRPDVEREPDEQRVALSSIPAVFGGSRVYFICPGTDCGRRVAKLFLVRGLFLCRRCHGLAYESQSEDAKHRARRRADKLRERLGTPSWSAFALAPPTRPKAMWRMTFDRLRRSIRAADNVANAIYIAHVAKLIGRVDRRGRPRKGENSWQNISQQSE
jgi:hypothetical protein